MLYQTEEIRGTRRLSIFLRFYLRGYNNKDQLDTDGYDANGNTLAADGKTFSYTYDNRLKSVNGNAITLGYDGNNNRVRKTVGGVTTNYLVDELSPSGYAQVVEELVGGQVKKAYTWGHMLISQRQLIAGSYVVSHYGQDGSENVRQLFDNSGAVTDTFDYDAFGVLIGRTGTTANSYLYRSQQFDGDLGFYYNRARYYDQTRGRFLSRDEFDGSPSEPRSLHKYQYGQANPITFSDPSGFVTEYAVLARTVMEHAGATPAQFEVLTAGGIILTYSDGSVGALRLANALVGTLLSEGENPVEGVMAKQNAAIFVRIVELALLLSVNAATGGGDDGRCKAPPCDKKCEGEECENKDDKLLYRGMKELTGSPEIGPTARTLGVRPNTDILVELSTQNVSPGTGGMSVAPDTPFNLPSHRRPPKFGGTGPDPVWEIKSKDLGANLVYVEDSPTHGTIQPVRVMTLNEYQRALAATQSSWSKQ